MFSIGERVVYRHHVCEVAALRSNYYEGKDYLELHALFESSLKLFVAIDEAKPPALRPVMSKDEAQSLIARIGAPAESGDADNRAEGDGSALFDPKASAPLTPTILDRQIKEEYDKRMKSFSPEELLPIMQCAYERSMLRNEHGRTATALDTKYFNLALTLLCDELSVSLGIARDEIDDYLDAEVKKNIGDNAAAQLVRSASRHRA